MFVEGSRTDLENLRVGGEKADLLLLRAIFFHGGLLLAHIVWGEIADRCQFDSG